MAYKYSNENRKSSKKLNLQEIIRSSFPGNERSNNGQSSATTNSQRLIDPWAISTNVATSNSETRSPSLWDELSSIQPTMNDENDDCGPFVLNQDISIAVETPPPKSASRKCADCKKAPQMQCLHCSNLVCMDCAQKHVDLANQTLMEVQHVLNDKINVIDRLAVAAKERVNADRNKIVELADVERDRALIQIDQLAEQQKTQIRDKCAELHETSLDQIPSVSQSTINAMKHLDESNAQLFQITSTWPKIVVQQKL